MGSVTAATRRHYGYYNNNTSRSGGTGQFRGVPPPALPNMDGEQMLWSIIGANTFIFACWHTFDPRMMHSNFAVSEESMYNGRVHTAVTAAFSHYDFGHYATNMAGTHPGPLITSPPHV